MDLGDTGSGRVLKADVEIHPEGHDDNDVRQKPDIAAADGVSTTVFSSFFGTSAAAPSAAGVAALILSAKSSIRVDDAYAILRSRPNTIDCLVAGTGYPGATWYPALVDRLAQRHAVLTFDHRGTGATPVAVERAPS